MERKINSFNKLYSDRGEIIRQVGLQGYLLCTRVSKVYKLLCSF